MPCDVQMIAAITRAITYVIATLGGVLSIYLGYRLYVRGVDSAVSGSASHAGFSGTLRSTGPGVFLVLFGAAILTSVIFSKANFVEEETSANSALNTLASPKIQGKVSLLNALASPNAQAQVAYPARQDTSKGNRSGQRSTADCILTRKTRRESISFIDGGPLSIERLRAATEASLRLNAAAREVETDFEQIRRLELTRVTLEALKAEMEPD